MYQLMNKALAQSVCFTRFLIERDCLSVAMTRLGNGFCPPSVLSEAKHHLTNIQNLVVQLEQMAPLPKNSVVARDYHHLMEKSCCGRD